jgi:hypothetical protein
MTDGVKNKRKELTKSEVEKIGVENRIEIFRTSMIPCGTQ